MAVFYMSDGKTQFRIFDEVKINFKLVECLEDSKIFSKELDPDFQRVLAKHNLNGKKKRTRW